MTVAGFSSWPPCAILGSLKPVVDPFALVLRHACQRFFADPCDLAAALDADAFNTLHVLSSAPQAFGRLRRQADQEHARQDHANVLTAAKAYVVAKRKLVTHAVDQPTLPLEVSSTDAIDS